MNRPLYRHPYSYRNHVIYHLHQILSRIKGGAGNNYTKRTNIRQTRLWSLYILIPSGSLLVWKLQYFCAGTGPQRRLCRGSIGQFLEALQRGMWLQQCGVRAKTHCISQLCVPFVLAVPLCPEIVCSETTLGTGNLCEAVPPVSVCLDPHASLPSPGSCYLPKLYVGRTVQVSSILRVHKHALGSSNQ